MRLLEMRPPHEITRFKFREKKVSRRNILKLGVASAISMSLRDTEPSAYQQIGNYNAHQYAHNVDTLSDLERVKGTPFIEIDESQLNSGKIVIAHSVKEFENMSPAEQLLHEPPLFIDAARSNGSEIHVDRKSEPEEEELKPEAIKKEHDRIFREHILDVTKGGHTTVSGPDHDFLWNLADYGFKGRLLYTLRSDSDVERFLKRYSAHSFSSNIEGEGKRTEFGVSIRFTSLTDRAAGQLKDERGLYILAWTPNTSTGVLDALQKGAHGITSDRQHLLRRIGSNLPAAA